MQQLDLDLKQSTNLMISGMLLPFWRVITSLLYFSKELSEASILNLLIFFSAQTSSPPPTSLFALQTVPHIPDPRISLGLQQNAPAVLCFSLIIHCLLFTIKHRIHSVAAACPKIQHFLQKKIFSLKYFHKFSTSRLNCQKGVQCDIIIIMDQQGNLSQFEVIKKLGEGAFGQVYMVKRRVDGQTYALKKVKMGGMKEKEKDNALNEIRILASLNDEYIVKFKEAFYDSPSNCLCIIMEFAKGGDVLKLINAHIKSRSRVPETQIWKALIHILKGLKSLHEKKILHRDLKSANVFVTEDGKYKLGDLNVSKVMKKGLAYTQTGTPYYASPEVWQDQPYDMKSDIWSLGCVIYELAALEPPFKASDLQSLFRKVKEGRYRPISTFYSPELAEMIGFMLKVKPRDRLNADEFLKHPTIKKKCGLHIEQAQIDSYYGADDPLLKTIKYNPHNLNSLKAKLPKSSYGNQRKERSRERRDSLDNIENMGRERVLSACGMRNNHSRGSSPGQLKKQQNRVPQGVPLPPVRQGMGLPPRPKRTEESVREPSYRLRRVGEEVLGRGHNRSSSVNR